MTFLGLVTNYMLRVSINLTIEYMTSSQNNSHHVDWTVSQQEDVKGAFFIGYLILQVKTI